MTDVPANHTNPRELMAENVYKEESYAIIGACFKVYNEKGFGFLEPVYQECLGIEFEYQRTPAIAKPSLALSYRGRILKFGHYPGLEYERIAKMQPIKGKSDFSDVSL
jgi:hypothetical protein